MLVRFIVNNVLSFGEQREFNMLPNSRLKTLAHHKYNIQGIELLKLTSIYGANGAGKSNLVKALSLMNDFVNDKVSINSIRRNQFKFNGDFEQKQLLALEFIQDEIPFYYEIEIDKTILSHETLYKSGLGKIKDELIYERTTNTERKVNVKFNSLFEKDEKIQILKQILLEDFIEPEKPILKLLSNRENTHLRHIKTAFEWFKNSLEIIEPDAPPVALALKIEAPHFKQYAEEMMKTFELGITSINSEKKNLTDFFENDKENLDMIIQKIEESPTKIVSARSKRGEELIFVKENDTYYVKQLKLEHTGKNGIKIDFDLANESDGTLKLLNFVPLFRTVTTKQKVYIIDEIERSIHPSLIKELIKKFSEDPKTKGQLIFTTHECNLLDQNLFRQDEIWFAEKDKSGTTDIYSLSAFREHKTIDIRKGYLNGKYGALPFLSNLEDLNWHKYDNT